MDESLPANVFAPKAELTALSFCEPDPESLTAWVESLPMANTSDTATQIRQAIFEVARLEVDFQQRMVLLENLRPTLHYLCTRLDRSAINTSVHGDTIARLAQRLQTNLCSGYKAVILEAVRYCDDPAIQDTLALAIHRALSDLSRSLLRTLQFYVAPADRLWLEANQLYLLAERLGVNEELWSDSENHTRTDTSIKDAYLRSILLALSKPNQLRHRQLSHVFNALETWSEQVSLGAPDENVLFCVDLESDQGPRFARMIENPGEARSVITDPLAHQLEAYLKTGDGSLVVPDRMQDSLVKHLNESWGTMSHRSHLRSPANSPMKVCVGLSAAHYFLSGEEDFLKQLANGDAATLESNPFQSNNDKNVTFVFNDNEKKDVWDDAFDLRVKIPENPNIGNPENLLQGIPVTQPEESRNNYQHYDTTTVDTSPSGYRIRWNEPLPASVQTGELVALQEEGDPRWCISVVRWIRHDAEGTSMGVELLAPGAIPVAVKVINTRGGASEWARAFLLPELSPIGQTASLITPLVPFQPGQKIHVSRQGIQTTAQLSHSLLKTESFNQFTFRMLDGYLENTHIDINMINLNDTTDDREPRSR